MLLAAGFVYGRFHLGRAVFLKGKKSLKQLRGWFCAGLVGILPSIVSVLSAGPVLAAQDVSALAADWIIQVLLALVAGVVTLGLLNRRHRDKLTLRNRKDGPVVDSREDFVRALVRRDPQVLELLASGVYGDPPPELETLAATLCQSFGLLVIRFDSGETIRLSSESGTLQPACLPGKKFRLADAIPEVEAAIEDLCFSCRAGCFVLHFGERQAGARLRLANPAFAFQLRPESGQAVLLCPGDRLLDASDRILARFDPEGLQKG